MTSDHTPPAISVNASAIKSLLNARPFRPFTVFTTRTGSHTVADPSHALLTRRSLLIGTKVGGDGIIDDHVTLPLAQISRMEAS